MYIKIVLLIFFFLSFISPLNSKERYTLEIPDEIQIKLNNKNYNRYIRNGMRAFVDGSTTELANIKKKYKKWIKADIVLNSQEEKKNSSKDKNNGWLERSPSSSSYKSQS